MHIFVEIERIQSKQVFKFLQMLHGKCSQMAQLYYAHVIDIMKKPHMRFKSNSIFQVFHTLKITLSYTETYSMKYSWVIQTCKFVPLSESH